MTYYQRAQGQLVGRDDAAELDVAVLMSVNAPRILDIYERVLAQADFQVLTPVARRSPSPPRLAVSRPLRVRDGAPRLIWDGALYDRPKPLPGDL